MGFLGQLTNQLGIILKSQSAARRLLLLLLVGGSAVGLIWLALATKDGGYISVMQNLSPQDAAEARVKLGQIGIEAKTDLGGSTLLVPSHRADEAMMLLAQEGIPNGGIVGMEGLDKSSIGESKFQQEKNYLRMREGELARTLLTLQEVEGARVHLALPDDSLFVKDEKQPTASVVLRLRQGRQLTPRQLNGIVHLVSHSVEGLTPDNVSIIDSDGNLLNSAQSDSGMEASATQASFKSAYEDQIKTRIETMLENIVGKGKVAARVTADFDFASQHEISEKYDPDGQVVKSEQESVEAKTLPAGTPGAGGAPAPTGSDSNLPGTAPATPASAGGKASPEQTHTDSTKEYALSREWTETQSNVPAPKRISVALLVDGVYDEVTGKDGKKTQQFRMRTDDELTKLQDLVKASIGFTADDTRQDQVTVECLPFKVEEQDLPTEKVWLSYPMRQMVETVLTWTVIALIGLLFIFVVLKPAMKQIMVVQTAGGGPGLLTAGLSPAALAEAGLEGASPEAVARLERFRAALPTNGELTPELQAELAALENELGAKNLAFNQKFQMNKIAAQSMNAQSEQVHKDVVDSAKGDPQRTVSLMRQWMDEA